MVATLPWYRTFSSVFGPFYLTYHYENTPIQILKILQLKNEIFQIKNSDTFYIPAQNIDRGDSLEPPRWGGSNEYPQYLFFSKIRKIMSNPVKPQFYYIKVGFKGSKLYRHVLVMPPTKYKFSYSGKVTITIQRHFQSTESRKGGSYAFRCAHIYVLPLPSSFSCLGWPSRCIRSFLHNCIYIWFSFVIKIHCTLRKHAYSNKLKILPPKYENFQIKISDIFHISAQNIDCGYSLELPRQGGSNENP